MPNRKENAGAKYLREHYNEVVARYPRQWVAANGSGVIAHHHDVMQITRANGAGVAFVYMKPAA